MARFLIIFGVVSFGMTAALGLIAPQSMFATFGITLDPAAMIEWRGVYGGVNGAIALVSAWSLVRPDMQRPVLMLYAVFTGGYAAGRVVSLAVDGMPGNSLWLVFLALEAGFAILSWQAYRKL